MTRKIVNGPQGWLGVEDRGAGPALPVLFIHSDGGNRGQWSEVLNHLAPSRRVIALDIRGHGESDPPRSGDLSFEGRAEDIGALLDALNLERVVLVGHSGGGATALTYAVDHPKCVAGLFLVDPGADPKSIPLEDRNAMLEQLRGDGYDAVASGYYASIAGDNPAVRDRVVADLMATPKATIVGTMTALNDFEPEELVGRYGGPTMALATPQSDTPFAVHKLGPGMPHRIVEGTGHWIHLDKPKEFNAILDEFLREVDKAADASQAKQAAQA